MHARLCLSRWSALAIATLTVASMAVGTPAVAAAKGKAGTTCGTTNVAIGSVATASSTSGTQNPANAIDGKTATHWTSATGDPQWLQLDLATRQNICQVGLNWSAYASAFSIQVSDDATNWTTLLNTTASSNGLQTVSVSGSGRYIRMYGTARGVTTTGYSVKEFQVFSQPSQPPAFTSPANSTFVAGSPGSFTVATSGVPTVSTITESGSLPAGITFHDNGDSTATLAGTPTGFGGSYPVTLTASNGVSPNAVQTLAVQVNQAPIFTIANFTTFTVGHSASFTVTTSGVPTVSAITESGSLPAGVSFHDNGNGTATLAGTAQIGTGGTYPMILGATNAVGRADFAFALDIWETPQITSADHATFAVGAPGSFTVTTAPGFPQMTTLSESGSLPAGIGFSDDSDGTATLAGTPAEGSGGVYSITVTAANGIKPDSTQQFTLTVNQPPTITSPDHVNFNAGGSSLFTILTAGAIPATVALTETGTLPAGVSFTDNSDGTAILSGTPAAGTGGSYTLTITASNGVAPNSTQTFTLSVNEGPAITSADHTAFAVGNAGSFTVTTTPGLPSSTVLTETGSLPSGVTFHDNGDGTATLAGTPVAGTGGSHPLTITASNGSSANADQAFTLTVTEPPNITSADHALFPIGSTGTFTITTRAGFPTATAISETGSLPPGITFHDNGNGTAALAGTPAVGSGGSYSLTLTATNSAGHTDQAFTLSVAASPVITSADHTTFAAGSAGSFSITTSPGVPSATALTTMGSLPSGITFHDNGDGTATLIGTPRAGTGGNYPITIIASNGASTNVTQSFTLTVTDSPVITSPTTATFASGHAGSFTITSRAGFPTSTTLTQTGMLPAGITFTDNGNGTATMSGTATATGSYPITVTASNGPSPASSQALTVKVNPTGSGPVVLAVTTTADIAANAGDCGNSSTTVPSPLSLREATCIANNYGATSVVINVPAGTYTLTAGELQLGKASGSNITLIGAGSASTILDGNHSSRVLDLDPNLLGGVANSISGVTITNGRDSTFGGAGIIAGSGSIPTLDTLNLFDSVVSNNQANFTSPAATNRPGGGLQFLGGVLTISNVQFTNNQSNSSAGSAVDYGVIGSGSPQYLTITGSTFTGNSTSNSGTVGLSGGALALFNNGSGGGTYTVANSTFTGNTASSASAEPAAGAAIYEQSGTLTVIGSTFTGNTITGYGALGGSAVYAAGTAALHYNRIAGNPGTAVMNSGSGLVNATENWWGCNIGPGNGGCDDVSSQVTASPRLSLSASVNPSRVTGPNGTATLTASLLTDSAGYSIDRADLAGAFDGVPVTFGDPVGDAIVGTSAGSHPVALSGGLASIDYHSGTVVGPDNDTVTLDNASYGVTVQVVEAPSITSVDHATFTDGNTSRFTVTALGYPSVGIAEIGSLPPGVIFQDNGDGTAFLGGIPQAGITGTYFITINASNGVSPAATQSFTLNII